MKKCLSLLLVVLLLLSGCSDSETTPAESQDSTGAVFEGASATGSTAGSATESTEVATSPVELRTAKQIQILLPNEDDPNWQAAGEDLLLLLENYFYQVELQYAGGSATKQAQQIADAVERGVDALILAPVDSAPLLDVCSLATDAGILIISYDRLLMDTEDVTCYISFDYQAMGRALATEIVNRANLETLAEGEVRTIEFFMGTPEDNNAILLYTGIMEVLEPWLYQGVLVTRSGRIALEDTCMVNWDAAQVTQRLTDYRKEYYDGGTPDILCTVSDEFANACISQLEENPSEVYPLITGLGGSETAVQQLSEGLLTVTVSTDLLQLNDQLAITVDTLLTGKTPEFNNPDTCHNNAITVPAYLCDFEILTKTEN